MTLPPTLAETLIAVSGAMADATRPWWIIASAAAALHGATPIVVADVDVLLDVDDAKRLLPRLGLDAKPGPPSDRFRSAVFATWSGNSLPVEFMAEFSVYDGTGWIAVVPQTRRSVRVRDVDLFVPERAELKALFETFGRARDFARARLL